MLHFNNSKRTKHLFIEFYLNSISHHSKSETFDRAEVKRVKIKMVHMDRVLNDTFVMMIIILRNQQNNFKF